MAWTYGRAQPGHGLADRTCRHRTATSLLSPLAQSLVRLGRGGREPLFFQHPPCFRWLRDGGQAAHVAGLMRNDQVMASSLQRRVRRPGPSSSDDEVVLVDVAFPWLLFAARSCPPAHPLTRFAMRSPGNDMSAMARTPSRRGAVCSSSSAAAIAACAISVRISPMASFTMRRSIFRRALPRRLRPNFEGIRRLKASFDRLGRYSDDASGASSLAMRLVTSQHHHGSTKKCRPCATLPGQRPSYATARVLRPRTSCGTIRSWMRNRFYADGERLLKPLRLSAEEIADLVAFLETLTPEPPPKLHAASRSGDGLSVKSAGRKIDWQTI